MENYIVWDLYNRYIPQKIKHYIRRFNHGSHYDDAYDKTSSIYIHIPKTAGTSVADALYGNRKVGHGHFNCEEFRLESEEKFETYFKFAFVRNPWDRLVSSYFHLSSPPDWVGTRTKNVSKYINARSVDFNSFVLLLSSDKRLQSWIHMIPQSDFIFSSGENKVDFIGKFESLNDDVYYVARKLNVDFENLPHNNKSIKNKHYSEYYNEFSLKFVSEFYKQDIDNFNYEFENKGEK